MKDAAEIEALRAAAHAVDAVAAEMRDRPFGGRTEIDVSRELVDRMLAHGHDRPNFAIVGSGPNGASPHHDAGARVIGDGDVVVCDFGGTMAGYCSDITRMFVVGEPTAEIADTYAALAAAQELAVRAATVGTTCEDVDAVAPPRARRPTASPTRSSIASVTASGSTPTRTRTSSPATRRRSRPGTRSASSPASTSPVGSGCGSRTSWSPTPSGPDRLNRAARGPRRASAAEPAPR